MFFYLLITFASFETSSNVHFIDKEGSETYMTVQNYPPVIEKKMKLLTYFKRYMTEHLVKAGASAVMAESDSISRIPHLHTWFRTMSAVVMHLTNGTVQVCIDYVVFTLISKNLFYISVQF